MPEDLRKINFVPQSKGRQSFLRASDNAGNNWRHIWGNWRGAIKNGHFVWPKNNKAVSLENALQKAKNRLVC
jgi:hypothetical protein